MLDTLPDFRFRSRRIMFRQVVFQKVHCDLQVVSEKDQTFTVFTGGTRKTLSSRKVLVESSVSW